MMRKPLFFLFLAIALASVSVNAEELVGNTILTGFDKNGDIVTLETNPPVGFFEVFAIFTEPGILIPGEPFTFNWQYPELLTPVGVASIRIVVSGPDSPAMYDLINLAYRDPVNIGGNTVFRISLRAPRQEGTYEYFVALLDSSSKILGTRESKDILVKSGNMECVPTVYGDWVTFSDTSARTWQNREKTAFSSPPACTPNIILNAESRTLCKSGFYIQGTQDSTKVTSKAGLLQCVTPTMPPPSNGGGENACTSSAWACTSFGNCIDGVEARTCTLKDASCTNPNAVKPEETQSCVKVPGENNLCPSGQTLKGTKEELDAGGGTCITQEIPHCLILQNKPAQSDACLKCDDGFTPDASGLSQKPECVFSEPSVVPTKIPVIKSGKLEGSSNDELAQSFCLLDISCGNRKCVEFGDLEDFDNVLEFSEGLKVISGVSSNAFVRNSNDIRDKVRLDSETIDQLNTLAFTDYNKKSSQDITIGKLVDKGGICISGKPSRDVIKGFALDLGISTTMLYIIVGVIVTLLLLPNLLGGKK